MFKTIKYGVHPSQIGDLYLPTGNCVGIICLFHGGFWKMPYDRIPLNEIGERLMGSGYCVWNIEYRRAGEPDRIWSDTFADALSSVQFLGSLKKIYPEINMDNVIVAGHSAGGHLALWLSTQEIGIKCQKFIGLAPIVDLRTAYYKNAGGDSVLSLIGGSPEEYPDRYKKASPIELLEQARDQIIVHGVKDNSVLVEWSRTYVEAAKEKGKNVDLIEVENSGHMDFLEPRSAAFQKFVDCLGGEFNVLSKMW